MNEASDLMACLPPALIQSVYRVVEPAWPLEGCGFLFEPDGGGAWYVIATENRAQALHEKDPVRYPHGGAEWFEPNMKPWFQAVRAGAQPRVIFHSHPEVGAYFSRGDYDSAVTIDDGGAVVERHPGVLHIVVSVRGGRADESALFRFNEQTARFDELGRFDAEGALRL
jgi:proteasome lid subunit RPN8/RPN11